MLSQEKVQDNNSSWHLWVIKTGGFKHVDKFVREEVPQVLEMVYPQVRKEKFYRNKIKIKLEAQFMNYLFIKNLDADFNKVVDKFNQCRYITTYVGLCSKEDIEYIEKAQELDERRIYNPSFFVGEEVKIVGGPFSDFKGKIKEIRNNEFVIITKMFNRATEICVPKEQVDFIQ